MPRLPTDNKQSRSLHYALRLRVKRVTKAIMRSHKFGMFQGRHLPIRLRPWFIVMTVIIMIILSLLGFTNLSRSVPLNDKILHFICMGVATGVFYFIFDVDEEARRVWFWRHSGLIFTAVLCFFFGGIASEFVQSLLPYKTFQIGDVVANLLGSSLGLFISYNLERYYRHRREISRLYQPLNTLGDDEPSSDDDDMPALPLHQAQTQQTPRTPKFTMPQRQRLADVWDSREEVFAVGDEEEEGEDLMSGYRMASGVKSKP